MSGFQVRVLYDFEAQAESEISIQTNEILTVTNSDVGEGWWEGLNSSGQSGLFPAAYVETLSKAPPSMPPPPLPIGYERADDHQLSSSFPNTPQHQADDWDDEWDDDEDSPAEHEQTSGYPYDHALPARPGQEIRSSSTGDVSTMGKGDANKAIVRKNFNRFSTFVKSGSEDYILGKNKLQLKDGEVIHLLLADDGSIIWAPNIKPYSCRITSPKKESKLKGLKSYIAYQITTTSGAVVSRRYKHFDWLHQRLVEKFTIIPIPPLPDKQISGRYEESFIEHRRILLQRWVDRITRHPVLSQCSVWNHFLECTDEKSWKVGKRRAEKDELVGASFFYCVFPPAGYCEPTVELQIDNYGKFIKSMDDSVRNLQAVSIEQTKKFTGQYKRDYQKVGHAFLTLANSFDFNKPAFTDSQDFIKAIRSTGETYDRIGQMFEEQPKQDFEQVTDTLYEYKGMLSEFPDILAVHKGAFHKTKEIQKLGSITGECEHRMNVLSYSVLAEMNHLKGEIVVDFNVMMKNFLTAQIKFYDEISEKLRGALAMYQ